MLSLAVDTQLNTILICRSEVDAQFPLFKVELLELQLLKARTCIAFEKAAGNQSAEQHF